MPNRCVFCGCTDDRACTVQVGKDAQGHPVLGGCSWHTLDPAPVCSHPRCVDKFSRELPRHFVIPPGTRRRECTFCGQPTYLVTHPRTGRLLELTTYTRLGRAPTATAPGYGMAHAVACTSQGERRSRPRAPALAGSGDAGRR